MAKATASGKIEFTDKAALMESLGASSSRIRRSVMELAYAAHTQWVNAARLSLHSSQREYIHAIQPVKEESGGASITLQGAFANMIEHGTSGIDLRQSILNNIKPGAKPVKVSTKVGRYRIIPMRRMTSDATGRNFPVMGAAYDTALGQSQSATLRSQSVDFLKGAQPTRERNTTHIDPATKQKYVRFETTRAGVSIPSRIGGPRLNPLHTTGLYSGMTRVGGNRKGEPAKYVMFRTISEKDSSGWKQPPLIAKDLVREVERWIQENAKHIIGNDVSTSVYRE